MQPTSAAFPIHRALPVIVRGITQNLGLRHEFGNSACTDGQTVRTTYVDASDAAAQDYALGEAVHECAHCLYTDFGVWQTLRGKPQLLRFANMFEDVRIEKLMMGRLLGAAGMLNRLFRRMVDDGAYPQVEEHEALADLFDSLALYRLRAEVLGQHHFAPLASHAFDQAVCRTDATFVQSYVDLIGEVRHTRSTFDCIVLAKRVLEFLQQVSESPSCPPESTPQEPEDGQPSHGTTGNGSDSQPNPGSQVDSDEELDSQASSQSSPGNQSCDSDDSIANDPADGAPQGPSSGTDQSPGQPGDDHSGGSAASFSDNARSAAQQLLDPATSTPSDLGSKLREILSDMPGAQVYRQAQLLDPPVVRVRSTNGTVASDLNSASLASRLRGLLHAKSTQSESLKAYGKKVDRKALLRVPFGDLRVFRAESEVVRVDTAVCILIDVSGSMDMPATTDPRSPRRLDLALASARRLMLTLDRIKDVQVSCAAFGNDRVFDVRGFGEPLQSRLGALDMLCADNGTPLAQGVIFGSLALLKASAARKILFVLTDGEPDCVASADTALARARASGIESVGIGMGLMTMSGYDVQKVIANIAELDVTTHQLMQRLLAQSPVRQAA